MLLVEVVPRIGQAGLTETMVTESLAEVHQ